MAGRWGKGHVACPSVPLKSQKCCLMQHAYTKRNPKLPSLFLFVFHKKTEVEKKKDENKENEHIYSMVCKCGIAQSFIFILFCLFWVMGKRRRLKLRQQRKLQAKSQRARRGCGVARRKAFSRRAIPQKACQVPGRLPPPRSATHAKASAWHAGAGAWWCRWWWWWRWRQEGAAPARGRCRWQVAHATPCLPCATPLFKERARAMPCLPSYHVCGRERSARARVSLSACLPSLKPCPNKLQEWQALGKKGGMSMPHLAH